MLPLTTRGNSVTASDRYPHIPERNARICTRYDESRAEGLSFDALGVEFGRSGQTVRQIIRDRDRARSRAVKLEPLRNAFAKGLGRPKE